MAEEQVVEQEQSVEVEESPEVIQQPTMITHKVGQTVELYFIGKNGGVGSCKALFTGEKREWMGEVFYLYIHKPSEYNNWVSIEELEKMQPKGLESVEEVSFKARK